MEPFFSRYKNALVLMLVLLAQVVLLAMQVRRPAPDMPDGHNVRLWRYLVAAVITPPERWAHNVGRGVRGVWANYIDLRHLREQNNDLAAENDRLRLEQASLAEDAREGERLRDVLDFRGRYIDTTVPAQVIGTSGTDQARVIIIDKGSAEGLASQMPVITPDGIVGKIKNVFPHTAQVLLISDQTSGAGVMLQSTRIRGVMKGDAAGRPQMINISPDERIKPGEEVLTSGGDQVYPRGLPVGIVDHIVADPDTSYVNVVIRPNADLAKLEEVLVVTRVAGTLPFGEEKDMMQSEVDALAEKQRAADILSEKLPSLRDEHPIEATTAEGATGEGATGDTATAAGDPARPMRPPQPLHADRYSPGAAPAAEILTPGQAPPVTHRAPTFETDTPAAAGTPKLAGGGVASGAASTESAPVSRFPPKRGTAPPAMGEGGNSVGSASLAATAPAPKPASPAGAVVIGGGVAPRPRPVGANGVGAGGSGLSLPLQPAASAAVHRPMTPPVSGNPGTPATATRPAVSAGSGVAPAPATIRVPKPVGGATVSAVASRPSAGASRSPAAANSANDAAEMPRTPAVTGVPAGTPGSAATANPVGRTPVGRSPVSSNPVSHNPAAASLGATGGGLPSPGTARPGGAIRPAGASPPAARRIVIPADSGGILTPAGMGQIGGTPRPRPAVPGATGTPSATPRTNLTPSAGGPAAKPAPPRSTPSPLRPSAQPAPAPQRGV